MRLGFLLSPELRALACQERALISIADSSDLSRSIPGLPCCCNVHIQRAQANQHSLLPCSRLLHPHIIQFREVFLTEKYLAIAMEYAPGGDMFQHVKRRGGLEEAEVFAQSHPLAHDFPGSQLTKSFS